MNRLNRSIHNYIRRLNSGISRKMLAAQEEEPAFEKPAKNNPLVNIVLFILTLFTTTYMGSVFFSAERIETVTDLVLNGLPYSVTLLAILLSHEFGHYFAARSFGVSATYPYFIPFPSLIGTMGAVIKTRTPIPHHRALFYIGAMGPIPGFIVSLAAVIFGVAVSDVHQLPQAGGDVIIFGDSLLIKIITYIIHGPIPYGMDLVLSPFAAAGWVGFLITGLNLMPIGQLDGGHILYALIGKKQKNVAWVTLGIIGLMAFCFPGWIIWIILSLTVLMVGHPPVQMGPELSGRERLLGWACMAILILTFIPVPIKTL